ncbi:MAG TPA: hypothetical protein VF548_14670 [Allosphingosinicella sp.]
MTYVAIRIIGRIGALSYRWCAALGWASVLLLSSSVFWLLYRQAEAEAAAINQSNIGIPLVYLGLWLASFLGSVVGLVAFLVRTQLKSE